MKRLLSCFFVALLCASCFFACGKKATSESTSTSESKGGSIAFVQKEIIVALGDSVKVEVETSKKNIFVFWSIRDEEIATVSDDGVITALSEGETICYAEFAGERVMCLVKVISPQATPMLSVSLPYEDNTVTLYVGDALLINSIVKLGDAVVENAQLEYAISQTDVVSVEDGKVICNKVGITTISICATYENQTATVILTVNVVEK